MVLEVLVSDGCVKLAFTALLAHHLFSESLSPSYIFSETQHLSIWPAVLLDCFLLPDTAALMTGPLIKSCEGEPPPGKLLKRWPSERPSHTPVLPFPIRCKARLLWFHH